MRLKDKLPLIAGAGAGPGMGRATALLFAQEGANVGVIARDPSKGEETDGRFTVAGGEAIDMAGDLTVRAETDKAVNEVIECWGMLDILYYGAGSFFVPTKGFDDVDEEFWHLALSNALDGLYNIAQATRSHLRGGGVVVTIAASYGVRQEGNPAC